MTWLGPILSVAVAAAAVVVVVVVLVVVVGAVKVTKVDPWLVGWKILRIRGVAAIGHSAPLSAEPDASLSACLARLT